MTNGIVIDEKSAFGTFIHQVMCASHAGMSEQEIRSMIKRLAIHYDISVNDFEKELSNQVHEFYVWLENKYQPKQIHKELPLMMEKENQLINGIADLVIENENEVILIDYKTFTGNEAALRYKVGTFSGQMKIYEEVLRKFFVGKKVRSAIYFIMEGRVIWMEHKSSIKA
jgi:ATP-dependent exoDNAse (exonuclease V) beta subunit